MKEQDSSPLIDVGISAFRIIGGLISFALLVLIGVLALQSRAGSKREMLCGRLETGSEFHLTAYVDRAAELGFKIISVHPTDEKNTAIFVDLETRSERPDVQAIDAHSAGGEVFSTIGFSKRFNCKVKFKDGRILAVSRTQYD